MTGAGSIDVERVRADTPGLAGRIHLNHAGSSPSPRPVLDATIAHLRREAEIGGYEAAAEQADAVAATYTSVARLLGCDVSEVALTTSATNAWEQAFWSLPWNPGDVVLTSHAEYVSNALSLLLARDRAGVEVRLVPDDRAGQVDVDALGRMLEDPAVALVAVTHVPTQGGLVNPAAAIGQRCRAAGVPFLLDACQSVGQLPTRVDELGCDLLSATGRKYLRAPRGTGFLYVRTPMLDRMSPSRADAGSADWTSARTYRFVDGAKRFETWERSIAGVLGLGAAVDYALDLGLDAIAARVGPLADGFRGRLGEVPGVTVRDQGDQRCGIVTFTVDGHDPDAVREALAADGVNVWVSGAGQARFDLDDRGITEMVRASLHYTTTDDELDRVTDLVAAIAVR
jgi:cysteine desulfurase / selenocysteine lyase